MARLVIWDAIAHYDVFVIFVKFETKSESFMVRKCLQNVGLLIPASVYHNNPCRNKRGAIQHDAVIKHFQRYWPFVRGIHRPPVDSPHKGQWRGGLMFSWICALTNGWVHNPCVGHLKRHHAHHDVTIMRNGLAFRKKFFVRWIFPKISQLQRKLSFHIV